MTKHEAGYSFLGAIFSVSIGSIVLQGLGAFILGLLGAMGGWVWGRYLKPFLEKKLGKP